MITIFEDTRNQEGKHKNIHEYFASVGGINLVRTKIFVGDYTLATDQSVCIDTKADVLELLGNLSGQYQRFRRELIRAKEAGIKLIILTEEVLPEGGLANWVSPKWKSTTAYHKRGQPKTRVDPAARRRAMITIQEKYGCKFLFCDKKDTGRRIVELLTQCDT